MTALAAWQQAFARAVWDGDGTGHPAAAQAAFAVYRNTVLKGCIDALQANHPTVARLVGEPWFRSAAALYVRAAPPVDPRLLAYGTTGEHRFAAFLQSFEPAADLPYLPGVALLDALWTDCHVAADAPAADAGWLAALDPAALGALRLRPHPAARWHWFDTLPVYTIWSTTRAGATVGDALLWQGEGALLTRPADAVQWCALDAPGCAWLDACAAGATLAEAAGAALQTDPGCDIAALLALLLQQGALTATEPRGTTP